MTKEAKAVQDLADAQLAAFKARLTGVTKKLKKSVDVLLHEMETEGGRFVIMSDVSLQRIPLFYESLKQAIIDAGYNDIVATLQESDTELIASIRANSFVPMAFSQTSKDVINSMRAQEAWRFYDISDAAMEAVRNVVYRSVITGAEIEESIGLIHAELDKRLQRYAWTYANTARSELIQAVHFEAAKNYDGELFWLYDGPDDELTRPACQIGIGRETEPGFPTAPYFTNDEMLTFEAAYADEREYNCRHYFVQITQEYFEKHTEEA